MVGDRRLRAVGGDRESDVSPAEFDIAGALHSGWVIFWGNRSSYGVLLNRRSKRDSYRCSSEGNEQVVHRRHTWSQELEQSGWSCSVEPQP